jgi:hypothetical protein
MKHRVPRWTGVQALAALFALGVPASAQTPLSSLGGVVRNETGQPVEQVQVVLTTGSGTRAARTNRDGRFRFDGVAAGAHRLRFTRIGFQPVDTTVTAGASPVDLVIGLTRVSRLEEVAVVARRLGVYGTVLSRDSLAPVEGARMELLGALRRDTTDATGAFAIDSVKPGTFMLRVSREGFDTQLLSVRVPRDSGVGLDLILVPGYAGRDDHMQGLWTDMAQRINWAGMNASFVGREELMSRGSSLDLAIRFAPSFARKSMVIDDRACVFVNGIARPNATIRDFAAEEIESIEVYGRRGEITNTLKWPDPRLPCGDPAARPAPGNRAVTIAIWTRQ